MKKNYKKSITNRIYIILALCWVWMGMSSCLSTIYVPSSDVSFVGTSTFCQGSAATATTYSYGQCGTSSTGLGSSGTSCTVQWYYNTTGGAVIATSTPLGAPVPFTSPAGGTGTLTFTPVTTAAGTYYYFGYISWTATGLCSTDYTSNTRTITITAPPATISGTASLCAGSTTTLSASASGGVWSSTPASVATVSPGGVVTGVAPGNANVLYTLGGCAALQIVTVNAQPTAITPTAATVICQGATTTLSETLIGGTWSSTVPSVATISTAGLVTGVGPGTTTISYTTTAGCYVTKPVTVNPVPGAILGPAVACPGLTNLYTNASSLGGTWLSSNTTVATIGATTGLLTGLTPGTTILTYTSCGSATRIITINANPAAIDGPSNVCEGGGVIALSDLSTGGTWSSSIPSIATITTAPSGLGVVTGLVAGTTVITFTSSASCFAFKTLTVDPLPGAITGIVQICAGQNMTLSNPIPGGTWSSSVSGIASVDPFTGVVTGVAGGTSVITYTSNCGYATAIATINALPEPITGRDTVCVGAHTTLANETVGGTWSSSNIAVATVLPGSGLITGVEVGTTYITYTMPGGCFVTDLLTAYLLPSSISGATQICPGTTTVLSNATTGGTWSSTNPAAASIGSSSGVVTGLSADTVTMIYTTTAGCRVKSIVTVNPLPQPIQGVDDLCASDIDTLVDVTPGGVWSSLTPGIVTIDPGTGILTTVTGGSAIIKYTLPATGCYITKTFPVTPQPLPPVFFNGLTNTFYTNGGYLTYQWYNSIQGLIPGAITYSTAGLWDGYYYVVVSDETGCKGASPHIDYNQAMAAGGVNKANLKVYPNPSTEVVYIESPVPVTAVISTMDGKTLIEQPNAKKIDISKFANGIYTIKVYDNSGTLLQVQKLVKE